MYCDWFDDYNDLNEPFDGRCNKHSFEVENAYEDIECEDFEEV